MFTGIVTDIGTIRSVEQRGDLRLIVATDYDPATIDLGASIACSGVCLTVVDKGADWLAFDASGETVSRTAPGMWAEGRRVNLERALRLGDELGGHLVTGHVDGVATIVGRCEEGDSVRFGLRAPEGLGPYLAAKGSVTLDGVSLTVNEVRDGADGTDFAVNIIPHTADHTTLSGWAVGDGVNLEIDVLARYLKRMADARM
ncbi:riboflavin synthase [Sphingomonas sp. ASV193]|uniref:riboflavin synthase n=1 Tax=Sphingomonas sp. ASV193 TaxID=3144405 RepID=UPI0032E87C3D